MIWDLLASADAPIALELLERTASTPRVQQAVELSLAPAFLLVGIGGIMNVMMTRLTWIAGRIERLSEPSKGACEITHHEEVEWLKTRRRFVRSAIKYLVGAAATVSVVIAVLFISAFIQPRIGTFVLVLWLATVGFLITGLGHFLRETFLAADGPQQKGK